MANHINNLITSGYPWNSSSLQQFMASISECDKLTAFQAITDHFLSLLKNTIGFQYTLKLRRLTKCHGMCYYFLCNLSEATRDRHQARSNPGQPKKRFSNPKKRYPCSGSLSISISPVEALDKDNQPIVTLKYQHTHIHRPPIDKRVDPEIIQFIEEHKLNPPADIERMLRRDVRFTGNTG